MDGKHQLVVVASVMIICVSGTTADVNAMNMYNGQGSPTDSTLDSFLSSNNMRHFKKQNTDEGIVYDSNGPITYVEEYGDIPTSLLPVEMETDIEGNDGDFVPDFDDSVYNTIYTHSLLENNRMAARSDESAFNMPSTDWDYPGDPDRKTRNGFVNMVQMDDGVYPLSHFEDLQTRQGHNSDPHDIQVIDIPSSESPIDNYSVNDVSVNQRSKRHSKIYWRSIFGHHRPQQRRKQDKRPERKRYYGRRISFFDTLASRIIGK